MASEKVGLVRAGAWSVVMVMVMLLLVCVQSSMMAMVDVKRDVDDDGDGGGRYSSVDYNKLQRQPWPAGLYVFGASMVDAGENAVAMPRRSQAESPPYGMDYFSKPAGRWSNGRTFMDLISQGLGYGLLSPYLRSIGSNFTFGVNFASSGSTAQNTSATGDDSGGLFCLLVQVDQFREYQESLLKSDSSNESQVMHHFESSIYFIETAHNDYLKVAFKSVDFDPLTTVVATIASMKKALEVLYTFGARTFLVMNVTPLGCAPSILSNPYRTESRDEYGCKVDYLDLVSMHNEYLVDLLDELKEEYPLAEWILFDAYNIMLDAYHNPSKYGVKYPFQACCGAGGEYNFMKDVDCGKGPQYVNGSYIEAKRCDEPSYHIIWDSIHPVESFCHFLAQGVLNGSSLLPNFDILERINSYKLLQIY